MRIRRTVVASAFALMLLMGAAVPAHAQQMVFQFSNPSFQSQAIGSTWMLQTAQAQKNFDSESNRFGGFREQSPLERFQEDLQRQVLSQLSRKVVEQRFGELDLSQKSTYDFGNFQVDVTPGSQGISIEVFNALTGAKSTITIPEPR